MTPNNPIRLILPFPPSVNHLYQRYGNRTVKTQAARDFEQEVSILGRDCTPLDGDLVMNVTLYRSRKRGDVDNFNKALLDSLQGIAYRNDRQVVELHVFLRTCADNPRVEVEIAEVSYA